MSSQKLKLKHRIKVTNENLDFSFGDLKDCIFVVIVCSVNIFLKLYTSN